MTISGYFDDYDAAVAAALELERRSGVPGIYVTLNTIDHVYWSAAQTS